MTDRLRAAGWLPAAGLASAIAASFMAFKAQVLFADGYMGLYSGRFIAHHGVPHHEVFTSAGVTRWIDQQWLAHLIDYGAWTAGGYRYVSLLSVAAAAAGFAVLGMILHRRGVAAIPAALCITPAVILASLTFFVRAQAFAYLPFALLLYICLEDDRRTRLEWRTLLLVPLLAIWANLHGSVVLGAGIAACFLLYRAARFLRSQRQTALGYAILALLCALTPLATPYGLDTVDYYRSLLGNSVVHANVSEWRPAAFPLSLPLYLLMAALVAALVLAWRERRKPSLVLVAGVLLLAVPAALAVRNQAWFGMAAAVLLGDTFGRRHSPWRPMRPLTVALLSASALAFALVTVAPLVTQDQATFGLGPPHRAIAAAGAYVAAHPCARVLADDPAASNALWLEPSLTGRLAFDGRLEQYPQSSLSRWYDFQHARPAGWSRAVAGYDVLIATRALHRRLVNRLASDPRYTVLARDWLGIAVAKRGGCTTRPGGAA